MNEATPQPDYTKPLPAPVYPKLELPTAPNVAHNKVDYIPDAEGFINTPPAINQAPLPPAGKARIMIGIPMLTVTQEFFESFLKFWTELVLKPDPRYEVGYCFAYRKPVHMAEENLVNVAISNNCTHILLMDDDIYDITKSDLDKLFEADKDVIGGIMHASKFPHAMCAFRRYDTTKKVIDMPVDTSIYRLYEIPCKCTKCAIDMQGNFAVPFCPNCGAPQNNLIQKADLIPFAFTLMKLSVFSKIKTPWFHCTNKYPTDSWFADRLLEAGLEEYAHMGVRLNHAGVTDETKPHFMQMGLVKAQKSKAIVHLTPEEMDKHSIMLVNRMNEVEAKQKPKLAFANDGGKTVGNIPPREENLTLATHGVGR